MSDAHDHTAAEDKPLTVDERLIRACDWSDYRKAYGVSTDPKELTREHAIFCAGWDAGRRSADRQVGSLDSMRDRERVAAVWSAFGCASNPDDFKESVRESMWRRVLDMARESAQQSGRLYRENERLIEEIRRLRDEGNVDGRLV